MSITKENKDEFIKIINQKAEKEFGDKIKDSKARLETSLQRYNKLDDIIKKLYEDNVESKLTDERFKKLSADYENEQKELKNTINELKDFISKTKETSDNTNRFISLVNKYKNITELTPELLRNFVEKIYVSEKEVKSGKKAQRIRIIWNCIGEFETPAKQ